MAELPNTSTGRSDQQIALNNNAGAFTNINPTILSYYAEAIEDFIGDGGTGQGLEYQLPIVIDGVVTGWGPTVAVAPGNEPVMFGDKRNLHSGHRGPGPVLAQPPQQTLGMPAVGNVIPICRMRSATATATTVNFTEYQ